MLKRVLIYGGALALGAVVLASLDYQRLERTHASDIIVFLIAGGFLAFGVFVGARLFAPTRPQDFDGNPKAQAVLGISARELDVLQHLAKGHSNKEIADQLCVSPNTVKTHISRLFEKLEAKRRTDAIAKARALGLLR